MPFGSTITEVSFVILSVLFSLFYFVNSLYYSLSLLVLVVLLLIYLTSQILLSSLTIIMLCIVYIGAIMILIGYICAICPNVIVQSSFSTPFFGFLSSLFVFIYYFSKPFLSSSSLPVSLVDYFYSSYGFFVFITLVLILFITLLIVTSQYLTPNGPFRSVS